MPRNTPITPKRGRNAVPSRVLIGRLGRGIGSEEILSLDSVATALSQTGKVVSGTKLKHAFLGFQGEGPFSADQYFPLAMAAEQVTFPATLPDLDIARCLSAPAADVDLFLVTDVGEFLANGSHLACTVTFLTGQTEGTFVWNGSTIVNISDTLWQVCAHVPDAFLAGVQIIYAGDL